MKKYTLFDQETGTAIAEYARKDAAVKAGEKTGKSYQVQSPSGAVVHAVEVAAKPTSKGTKTVTYDVGAKVFWKAMGAAAVAHAEHFGLSATANPDFTITLQGGTAKERNQVAKRIESAWAAAYSKFQAWKREHKEERKGFRDTSEGRKNMLLKEWALLTEFYQAEVSE